MSRPKALTDAQEVALVEAYHAGMTMKELAAMFGCSVKPIQRVLSERGVKSRPAHVRAGRVILRPASRLFDEAQGRDLAERYRAGWLVGELADEAGVSRKAVNNALQRQGVQLRDSRQAMAHLNERRRAKGERHPNFKGGRIARPDGYVAVSITDEDPLFGMAKDRGRLSNFGHGYVLEHRLVMARHLGRPLTSSESVHHKNGKRDDNRIENLELWTGKHGRGVRHDEAEPHCPTCTCFRR